MIAAAELIYFKMRRLIRGINIPSTPQFGTQISTEYFLERLKACNFYLEYGSGGSTFQAARMQKQFVSVESDAYFLKALRSQIERQIGTHPGKLLYANIGLTEDFGNPCFKRPTERRRSRWLKYPTIAWQHIHTPVDLILIDGRFRVLCALFAVAKCRNRDVEILFDDYVTRPHYRPVEQFLRVDKTIGAMASLHIKKYDQDKLLAAIEKHSLDYH
jgi:hypothetical protein